MMARCDVTACPTLLHDRLRYTRDASGREMSEFVCFGCRSALFRFVMSSKFSAHGAPHNPTRWLPVVDKRLGWASAK